MTHYHVVFTSPVPGLMLCIHEGLSIQFSFFQSSGVEVQENRKVCGKDNCIGNGLFTVSGCPKGHLKLRNDNFRIFFLLFVFLKCMINVPSKPSISNLYHFHFTDRNTDTDDTLFIPLSA